MRGSEDDEQVSEKGEQLKLDAAASSISLAAIENGCACPARFRKDGQCLVMEYKRVNPIPADKAVQGVQWCSYFFEHILQQDPTAAPASLHSAALIITVGYAIGGATFDSVKVS